METIAYYECLADENNSIHHDADTENVNVNMSEGRERLSSAHND